MAQRVEHPAKGGPVPTATDGASGQRPWTSTVPSPSNSAVTTGTAAVGPPENTSQPARSRSQLVGGRLSSHPFLSDEPSSGNTIRPTADASTT
jgi:hypothetical protein